MASHTPQEHSFLEWLVGNGTQLSPAVGLAQFKGMGRGAIALQDIPVRLVLIELDPSWAD